MKTRLIGLAGLCLMALAAPVSAAPDEGSEVTMVKKTDPEMRAAITEAKRTLPEFLAALTQPDGMGNFMFKYPLAGWEHIWVDHVARHGDRLTGRLANDPVEQGFRLGQEVSVPLKDVSDWGYRDAAGTVHGHRTTRVLLPRIDPDQAQAPREAMGWAE